MAWKNLCKNCGCKHDGGCLTCGCTCKGSKAKCKCCKASDNDFTRQASNGKKK